jgi:prepilin-type N-terminal cleavage/methylation domain-containing protein
MKFPKLSLINKGQKGFTLMELAIALVIGGMIAGSVTMTIFQIVDSSGRTSNHMTAVRQVRSAGYWISHDVLMSQEVVIADELYDDPDGSRFPVNLTFSDWGENETHEVTYSIVGDELHRADSVNSGSPTNMVIAEFIDPDNTSCTYVGGKFTFTVTAIVGAGSAAQPEARTYEVIPRPGS